MYLKRVSGGPLAGEGILRNAAKPKPWEMAFANRQNFC